MPVKLISLLVNPGPGLAQTPKPCHAVNLVVSGSCVACCPTG